MKILAETRQSCSVHLSEDESAPAADGTAGHQRTLGSDCDDTSRAGCTEIRLILFSDKYTLFGNYSICSACAAASAVSILGASG